MICQSSPQQTSQNESKTHLPAQDCSPQAGESNRNHTSKLNVNTGSPALIGRGVHDRRVAEGEGAESKSHVTTKVRDGSDEGDEGHNFSVSEDAVSLCQETFLPLELLADLTLDDPPDDLDSDLQDMLAKAGNVQGPRAAAEKDDGDDSDSDDDGGVDNGDLKDRDSQEKGNNGNVPCHLVTGDVEEDAGDGAPSVFHRRRKKPVFCIEKDGDIVISENNKDSCSSTIFEEEGIEISLSSGSQRGSSVFDDEGRDMSCCGSDDRREVIARPVLLRGKRSLYPMNSAVAQLLLPLQPLLTVLPPDVVKKVVSLKKLYPGISEDYLRTLCDFGLLEELSYSDDECTSSLDASIPRASVISLNRSCLSMRRRCSEWDDGRSSLYNIQDESLSSPHAVEYAATPSVRGLFLTAITTDSLSRIPRGRKRTQGNSESERTRKVRL